MKEICMKTAIINGRIITPLEEIESGTVLIDNGKITAVVRGRPRTGRDFKVIDAGGKIACPGFIDLHLQGGGGSDVIEGTPEAICRVARTHARYGTTLFLATTIARLKGGRACHLKAIAEMTGKETGGARIAGIHLEGPFISPVKKGMIRGDYIAKPDITELGKIIKLCNGTLKMMTVAPELKGSLPLIKRLRAEGIIPSLGHTDTSYEEAIAGIKAGISHATHFCNAMTGLHHRLPGAVGACFDTDVSVQLIADMVHVHPAVVRLILKVKGLDRVALITDAVLPLDMPDGVYDGYRQKITVKNGVVRGVGGVLAGSTLTLDRAVRNINALGVPLADAIKMATFIPARILGIGNRKGILKKGADADILIIDRKVSVSMVMVGGKIAWKT